MTPADFIVHNPVASLVGAVVFLVATALVVWGER